MFAQLNRAHLHLYLCQTNGQNGRNEEIEFSHIQKKTIWWQYYYIFMRMRAHTMPYRALFQREQRRFVPFKTPKLIAITLNWKQRRRKAEKKMNESCHLLKRALNWSANPSGIQLNNLYGRLSKVPLISMSWGTLSLQKCMCIIRILHWAIL